MAIPQILCYTIKITTATAKKGEKINMLLLSITVLSVLGALGICAGAGSFSSTQWIWVLPVGFLVCWLVLVLIAVAYLFYRLSKIDMNTEREHDDPAFRKLVGIYAHAFCTLLRMRFHVTGIEKKPQSGRFLVVANHLHELDIPAIYFPFEHDQMSFVSKQENRDMFVVGKVMHQLVCPLLNRENDREALKTILKAIALIKNDEVSMMVFPEGHTSDDGRLHPFRSGSLKIATKPKVPIVVCTIQNTNKVTTNIKKLKPTDIYVHIVGVITPEDYAGMTTVALGQQVYQMMLDDLGPDYAPLQSENA